MWRLGQGVGGITIKLSSKDLEAPQDDSSEYSENITIDLVITIYPLEQSKKCPKLPGAHIKHVKFSLKELTG